MADEIPMPTLGNPVYLLTLNAAELDLLIHGLWVVKADELRPECRALTARLEQLKGT